MKHNMIHTHSKTHFSGVYLNFLEIVKRFFKRQCGKIKKCLSSAKDYSLQKTLFFSKAFKRGLKE